MATAAASASATLSPAAMVVAAKTNRFSQRRSTKVRYIRGLNSFEGLKAHNHVAALGVPVCADHSFAKIVSSLRPRGKGNGGGALSASCNAIAEIFRIAAIIPGLVLVGVAVGFVLLRVEAYLEESEE
ncbi:PREDICTED: uncharacterized protein LOC109161419 [Ipomoea nil]|uniref:uncharacterized protein LOC109161419 n=1 Tax=Ipomoea nil TaxID=35883 RepID=UPI0009015D76|nr:PREDICTED: uncharacterized protein LOC109161419 [Ipomoea nil]XP_019165356.1 PREDICTED: uncharacterized protein LOC109161419 [Ipomoea nil]